MEQEKKEDQESHPRRLKATEFCAKGSRVNRSLAGLHSAGELKSRADKRHCLNSQTHVEGSISPFLGKSRRSRREVQLRADPGWQDRVKEIDLQIEAVMRGLNRRLTP